MLWKAASTTLLLALTGWAQTSGDATQQPVRRSPFASPIRVVQSQGSAKVTGTKSGTEKPVNSARLTAPKSAVLRPAAGKPGARPRSIAAPVPRTSAVARKPAASVTRVADAKGEKKDDAQAKNKNYKMAHGRDPFVSQILSKSEPAAGCSTGGKKCLVIDRLRLKGVVRADSGFIAVVVNSVNRAYFLRENDPLFNGYVVRITDNAVIFKETGKDRLGKPVTRDVTKTLSGPRV